MSARRRRTSSPRFVRVSKRQLAGLGVVGTLGVLAGLNGVLDLAEKLARVAKGQTPSGKPIDRDS